MKAIQPVLCSFIRSSIQQVNRGPILSQAPCKPLSSDNKQTGMAFGFTGLIVYSEYLNEQIVVGAPERGPAGAMRATIERGHPIQFGVRESISESGHSSGSQRSEGDPYMHTVRGEHSGTKEVVLGQNVARLANVVH